MDEATMDLHDAALIYRRSIKRLTATAFTCATLGVLSVYFLLGVGMRAAS